jgi:RNA polymerase sigma-70 factor (ECF subfamily)
VNGRASDSRADFEQLFRETRTDLLAYIMRRSPSAEDAADVLAETYVIAWRKLDGIPTGERARLWLFGVARNLLLKGASQRRSRQTLVERLVDELRSAHPPHPVDEERASALRAALAALPERDRELVMLTAWEGLTPKQIAAVVRTPVNVVRVRLHRARTRLKRDLTNPQPPAPPGRSVDEQPPPNWSTVSPVIARTRDSATATTDSRPTESPPRIGT